MLLEDFSGKSLDVTRFIPVKASGMDEPFDLAQWRSGIVLESGK